MLKGTAERCPGGHSESVAWARLEEPDATKTNNARERLACSRASRAELRRALEKDMLYTLAVILVVAWLLGAIGTYTIGPIVHLLLVLAVVLAVVGFLSGRRTVV